MSGNGVSSYKNLILTSYFLFGSRSCILTETSVPRKTRYRKFREREIASLAYENVKFSVREIARRETVRHREFANLVSLVSPWCKHRSRSEAPSWSPPTTSAGSILSRSDAEKPSRSPGPYVPQTYAPFSYNWLSDSVVFRLINTGAPPIIRREKIYNKKR